MNIFDKPLASDHVPGLSSTEVLGVCPVAPASCSDPSLMLKPDAQTMSLTPVSNYLGCLGSYAAPVNAHAAAQVGSIHALREARIFDLGSHLPEFYAKAYELLGNVYDLQLPSIVSLPKRAETMNAFFMALYKLPASVLPRAPSKLPFRSIFVSYPSHLYSSFGAAIRLSEPTDPRAEPIYHEFETGRAIGCPMGLLVSEHAIIEYMMIFNRDQPNNTRHVHVLLWSSSTGWIKQQTMMPWIVTLIVDYLNSHNTLHQARIDKRTQHAIMKESKGFPGGDVRPRDYYTLVMRRVTLDASTRKFKQSLDKRMHKFRVDVRGHESVRVMRGSLPITPKDDKELRDRGYRVYTSTDLSLEDYRRLEHRDIRGKAPGEWIAVLSWWRDSFMSPANPELPYVPAVRKPTEPVLE